MVPCEGVYLGHGQGEQGHPHKCNVRYISECLLHNTASDTNTSCPTREIGWRAPWLRSLCSAHHCSGQGVAGSNFAPWLPLAWLATSQTDIFYPSPSVPIPDDDSMKASRTNVRVTSPCGPAASRSTSPRPPHASLPRASPTGRVCLAPDSFELPPNLFLQLCTMARASQVRRPRVSRVKSQSTKCQFQLRAPCR